MEGNNVGGHAEPFILAHLHHVDEQNFQQGKVQPVEHVQNPASHQHPENIWMEEGWRYLGKVEKLLEEKGQR